MSQKSLSKLMFVIFGLIGIVFTSRIMIRSHTNDDFVNYYQSKNRTEISLPNGSIIVDVAVNDADRQKGLSGKKMIDDKSGLLFVFEKPDKHGFWMKDMNFPIDIVWIDDNKKIIGISSNLGPETYPDIFFPPNDIKYALEINAGLSRKNNFATGTPLTFTI